MFFFLRVSFSTRARKHTHTKVHTHVIVKLPGSEVPYEGSESLHAAAASRQKEIILIKDRKECRIVGNVWKVGDQVKAQKYSSQMDINHLARPIHLPCCLCHFVRRKSWLMPQRLVTGSEPQQHRPAPRVLAFVAALRPQGQHAGVPRLILMGASISHFVQTLAHMFVSKIIYVYTIYICTYMFVYIYT